MLLTALKKNYLYGYCYRLENLVRFMRDHCCNSLNINVWKEDKAE